MDYLSDKTLEFVKIADEVSADLEFDIGDTICCKQNGDMAWYVLTSQDEGLTDMYFLLCTPYGFMAEYNFDEVRHLSVITDVEMLLNHLQGFGYRKLTPDEFEEFSSTSD